MKRVSYIRHVLFAAFSLWLVSSCGITRKLPEGSCLVDKNSVRTVYRNRFVNPSRTTLIAERDSVDWTPRVRAEYRQFLEAGEARLAAARDSLSGRGYRTLRKRFRNEKRSFEEQAMARIADSLLLTQPPAERRISRSDKVTKGEIVSYIPESNSPNSKLFGYPFQAWIYNLAKPHKQNWFNNTLRKLGQKPVIYDSLENRKSLDNIRIYMAARGYLDAEVTDTVRFKRRKAAIDYSVDAGYPYIISDVIFRYQDARLAPVLAPQQRNSLIRVGDVFSRERMEEERKRITDYLQNQGYYMFSVRNVDFTVDTTRADATAKVVVNIKKNVVEGKPVGHKRFTFGNISVNPDYAPPKEGEKSVPKDSVEYNGIGYCYSGPKKNIKPRAIGRALTIEPHTVIRKDALDETNQRLSNLNFFRNINILLNEEHSDPVFSTDTTEVVVTLDRARQMTDATVLVDTLSPGSTDRLDCDIFLMPVMRQGYKINAEASTNANYSGVTLTVGYTNKNIFKGAEILNISVTGSYDFFRLQGKKDSYEFGASASLTFPRLLVPFATPGMKQLTNVATQVEISYSRQRRPYYDRTLSNASYGYSWSNGKRLSYTYRPINISYINVPRKDSAYIASLTNLYLRNSYVSQVIAGAIGSFTFRDDQPRHHLALRINAETSGNLLSLGSRAFAARQNTNAQGERYYNIFNIRYAQYIRADLNLSWQYKFNGKNAIVYRFFAGGGHAYGNSKTLPFERLFFAGGSNSMRGWQVRTLGPGSTPVVDSTYFPNQLGNIRFEMNLEGRFNLFGRFRGAVFLDMGNIWSNARGETNSEAEFSIRSFYKQLALNTGIGLRLDLSYFVLRVDWGIQLLNPGWPEGQHWIRNFRLRNTALHFAIGYPF